MMQNIPFYIRMNRETQKAPEEELFVRWVQNGIFQPRFSIHSASSDNTVTEPWMYQESAPIMRLLVYEFQDDENVYDESFDT